MSRETPSCAGAGEQRCRAFHVEGMLLRQLLERGPREPQRARQQLVVERALLLEPREHRFAHVEQRQPGKFGVQVVGRLHEVVRPQVLAGIDHFLRDLPAARHHHHEDAGSAERHELETLQHGDRIAGKRKPDVAGGARHEMRHAGEQILDERRTLSLLAQPMLDDGRRPGALAALEQQVDEHAVAAVGRHAPGRGMRLMHVAAVLELREHAPDGRRRHAQPAFACEVLRRDRLARLDVLADERGQQPP